MEIKEYWEEFKQTHNLDKDTKYFDAFMFGDEDVADYLLDLVLKDKKIATTSAYFLEEDYPVKDSYSIVLDSKSEPRCVIQTVDYKIMPIKAMTYDICKLEGEDECLDTWLDTHVRMIKKDCDEYGYNFSFDQPIFFEIFKRIN